MKLATPFPNSYWVRPAQLLAGEHPMLLDAQSNRERIQQLTTSGISCFIDLTKLDETKDLESYQDLLQSMQPSFSVPFEVHRLPIPDMDIPLEAEMIQTLNLIDTALAAQRKIYVHCWGGIGRTGTVVGCYLVRHGLEGEAAIRTIARLRQHTPDHRYLAPARDIQRAMILAWQAGL